MKRIVTNIILGALIIAIGCFSFPRLFQRKEAISEQKEFQKIVQDVKKENLVEGLVKQYENEDIIGFLEIDKTNIKYPVVKGRDNKYYLNHGYNGKYQINGALFLDMDNSEDFTDVNSIIYGHRIASGTLFNQLPKLLEKDLYKEAEIRLTTKDRQETYKTFCIMKVSSDTDYRQIDFSNIEEYQDYLEKLIYDSTKAPGKELLLPPAKILTLSTCTYEQKDYRLVVVAGLTSTKYF